MKNVKITLMGTVLGTTLLLTGCGGAEAYEANAEENEVTYEQVEDDAYEVEEVVEEAKLFDRELRIGQPVDQSAFGYGQLLQVRTSANREVARSEMQDAVARDFQLIAETLIEDGYEFDTLSIAFDTEANTMERTSIIITMSREEIEQSMEATYWREFGMRWVETRAYLVHVKPMYR